jgi:putative transposase
LVKAAHEVSEGSAGARTISSILTNSGDKLSRYLAAKVMKRLGIVSKQPPKHNYKPAGKERIDIADSNPKCITS